MTLKIITVVLWGIAGVLELVLPEKISKFDYAICWITLMVGLIARLAEG